MDVNLIRSLLSVVVFAVFLGIVWWAYLPSRKKTQERVAQSVLGEDS
ncbi:MAG TPA: CcoQ/FixQ family Cbb3-type cytochrome c oxidase assembly chaperone [Burkholderiales bacterium]|nr:CcoQ/FixQ family Cbb3-type cytochrome c oxidase assembly chaperone [Burkholderiales bacterium]